MPEYIVSSTVVTLICICALKSTTMICAPPLKLFLHGAWALLDAGTPQEHLGWQISYSRPVCLCFSVVKLKLHRTDKALVIGEALKAIYSPNPLVASYMVSYESTLLLQKSAMMSCSSLLKFLKLRLGSRIYYLDTFLDELQLVPAIAGGYLAVLNQ